MNNNDDNSIPTKKQFILCFQGQRSYVSVAPTHTLVNVRQLLHHCLDACQLPDEDFLFRLDGILVSSKQEEDHVAFEILERDTTVELVPVSAVKKRKRVADNSHKKKRIKCDESSGQNPIVIKQHTQPANDVSA